MKTLEENLFKLRFTLFIIRFAQVHSFSRIQRQVVLYRFGKHRSMVELQNSVYIPKKSYLAVIEEIGKKLEISFEPDDSDPSPEENLRSTLLIKFLRYSAEYSEKSHLGREPEDDLGYLQKEFEFLKGKIFACETHETLLQYVESTGNFFDALKKVCSQLVTLTRSYQSVSEAEFFASLSFLPKLMRRFAATYKYTEHQVIEMVIDRVIEEEFIQLATADTTESMDIRSVKCFIERFYLLYQFPEKMTPETIFEDVLQDFQVCPRFNQNSDNLPSLFRLKAYSRIREVIEKHPSSNRVLSSALEIISPELEHFLEAELKDAWISLEKSCQANSDTEQPYTLLQNISLIKEYLKLATSSCQHPTKQSKLQEILTLATKSGLVAFWISQIDCHIIDRLKKRFDDLPSLFDEKHLSESTFSCGFVPNMLRIKGLLQKEASELLGLLNQRWCGWITPSLWVALVVCVAAPALIGMTQLLTYESREQLPKLRRDPQTLESRRNSWVLYHKTLLSNEPRRVIGQLTVQEGSASWTGDELQNHITASGEIFNKNKLTAAHPSFPFGTQVRVVDLGTNREITVRINDRFNREGGRIIALSKLAAEELGIVDHGIANVRIEPIEQ